MNSPGTIKQRIIEYTGKEFVESGRIEVSVLYGENLETVKSSAERNNIEFEDLGFGFGIVTLDSEKFEDLSLIDGLIYAELPKTLFTDDYSSNRACCIPQLWTSPGLTGKGVLVGFVDTGIDYNHPAFKDSSGNTRIKYIYDLSDNKRVYTSEDINRAIKSDNPLSIVPEQDFAGHGTHVAGIACGFSESIDRRGVAYESSIAMVKTTRYGNINFALSTQIMRGIKFLVDKAAQDSMPLVINISMSTNDGAHNGSSILEQYIETICRLDEVSIVVATGNDGDAGHHSGGIIEQSKEIKFSIAEGSEELVFQLYKPLLTDISIEIKNPQGRSSGLIDITQGFKMRSIGRSNCYIFYTGPKPFDINGEVVITLSSPVNDSFNGGTWIMTLREHNDTKIDNSYNIWMPTSESLDEGTRFLQPNPFFTIGIPATVHNVISVGSYDYLTDTIAPYSGRGDDTQSIYNNKPDVVAPGNNIVSSVPNGRYDTKSGTSMASPHVTGICALFMEWGIIKNNDPFLFGDRLKYFLLKGAVRNRSDITYPNPIWGYGKVCAADAFDILRLEDVRSFDTNMRQNENTSIYQNQDYDSILVQAVSGIEEEVKQYNDATFYRLSDQSGIFTAPYNQIDRLVTNIKSIVNYFEGAIYTLTDTSPLDASNAPMITANPYLDLSGNGVLVGIIDTGIDYLNDEFINEDGTTRIVALWDQTIKNDVANDTSGPDIFGKSYSRDDINNAITAKKNGQDPYEIVESKDNDGHGTAMASIIGSKGKNKDTMGVAPNCEFVIVKLQEIKNFMIDKYGIYGGVKGRYESIDIILGMRFLTYIAKKSSKPMVVYFPLGTNYGAHDGTSIIESFLNSIAENRGIIPVTNVGNQGDSATHASGEVKEVNSVEVIELNVGELQKNLIFNIWIDTPNKISITVVSPSGEASPNVKSRLNVNENYKYIYEGTDLSIKIRSPDQITGDERIEVSLRNIRKGIWKIQLTGDYIVGGRYNIWIPQKELLAPGTRFLSPDQNITLMTPSTSIKSITSAYYNQNIKFIVPASGRGYTRDGRIKPDISSGGVNAIVVSPSGGTTTISGASVGGAIAAGCCVLLLQWGVVNKNDIQLYSHKLKTYLIRGTSKRDGDIYPNRESGYGFINLEGVFNNLRSIGYDEKYIDDNIFMRTPER